MLSLFLGADDFSKREYINTLAEKAKIRPEFFADTDSAPSLERLLEKDLFASTKIFVLTGLISHYDLTSKEKELADNPNHVIFIEEKLDKRLSASKALLASKNITTKEFHLPHGKELNKWIGERVKQLGGKITADAIELLAKLVGRDLSVEVKFGGKVVVVEEVYNLWQVNSEIQKLLSFTSQKEITEADVENLVNPTEETDVLKIVNTIGEGKKNESLKLIEIFLRSGSGADEKGLIIQLNALLSEQFRNIFVLQEFFAKSLNERAILGKTLWKPGRLFILKKIAQKFSAKKVREFLDKLEHLDEELKTSSTPPRVLLDLILSQIF